MQLSYSRVTYLGVIFSLVLSHAASANQAPAEKALADLALTDQALVDQALAEQRFYPSAHPTQLIVGTEQFDDNYLSLAGLEGVHVIIKYVLGNAEKLEFSDMKTDLVEQIEKRLNSVGLRMLSEEEYEKTPGQPTLSFFPAYSGNDIDRIKAKANPNAATIEEVSDTVEHDCCRSSIWASFQQSSSILRAPNQQFKFATWGLGDDTASCDNRGAWTYDAVLKVIDQFVADFEKAEDESEKNALPKLVSKASEAPQDCGQSWLVNLSVFETNETRISDSVKPILDKLASTATRCDHYRYIIETHADQRADSDYNKVLSEARAFAVKDYLVGKNIPYDRLETKAFGESKPLTNGTSAKDHAVNRRVVIIPLLIKS